MDTIARAIADTREILYQALVAAQRDAWAETADALERAEARLRDLLVMLEERNAA